MNAARVKLKSTPRYDAWRESLRQAVAARGKKTALARFMAVERGQPLHTWQSKLAAILRGDLLLNSEDLLSISAWMDGDAARATPTNRRTAPRKT